MKNVKKMYLMVCVVIIMALIPATCLADVEMTMRQTDYYLKIGDSQFVINENNANIVKRQTSGAGYVVDMSIDLGFDEDGNMVPIPKSNGIMTLGSINEGETMVSGAFRWNGTISYDIKTFEGIKTYKPISYSFKVTELDSQFKLTSMSLHGGADGAAFDSNGNRVGIHSTGDRPYSISNAVSGQSYSKSYGTSYYYAQNTGNIKAYGTFKYKRKLATGDFSSEYTSSSFSIELV